jgi:hypothetical protein
MICFIERNLKSLSFDLNLQKITGFATFFGQIIKLIVRLLFYQIHQKINIQSMHTDFARDTFFDTCKLNGSGPRLIL